MNKKFVGGFFAVIVLFIAFFSVRYVTSESLYQGDTDLNVTRWNSIISKEINKSEIRLYVDGVQFKSDRNPIVIDENLKLQVPIDIVSDAFNCSENYYDKELLIIEKGSDSVSIRNNEKKLTYNDSEIETNYGISHDKGTLYVPIEIFTEYFNYSYEWDGLGNLAKVNNKDSEARNLPYYYSYEDALKAPKIRAQGNFGTCWAFASLTALESSLRPEEDVVFAVDHMALRNSFNVGINDGGDYIMSMAYLAAWQGPVLESDDAYDGVSGDYSVVKHIQEIQVIEAKNYNEIKEMIYKHGGVQSSLYTSMVNSSSTSSYYNKENSSYCYIGENKPNHDVVIIGWDDNYPKENFNADIDGNGAFICRNSWGKEFGDNGNFYVSYYDSNIGVRNIVYTGIETVNNYDNIYQTDLCGWVGNMGYKGENTAYFANVYKCRGNEQLEAVSFYATDIDTQYEVYVCIEYDGENTLNSNRRIAAAGTLKNQGYYTIKLNRSYTLEKGKEYAVIVKATTPNSTNPIAVEFVNDERTKNVDLEDGKGFISLKGVSWENVEKSKQCNVCLKAFTRNVE